MGIKTNLCNKSVGFNCRPGYYVSLKDEFDIKFIFFKIKIVGMDMKKRRISIKHILENYLKIR